MLLKWLFTALAILWLIQALRPYFSGGIQRRPPQAPPASRPSKPSMHVRDDRDEYIDYEEIK